MHKRFPIYTQLNEVDCGPVCLRMIAKYYGRSFTLETLRRNCGYNREGVSMMGISDAAEKLGFHARGVKITFKQLVEIIDDPCILHWNQNHFVVLLPGNRRTKQLTIADPAQGRVTLSKDDFCKHWLSGTNENGATGVALLLEETPAFLEQEDEKEKGLSWQWLFKYVKFQKKFIIQLIIGLLIGSLLQLIFPFLTQSIVDVGITTQNLRFIYLVLIAQSMLFFGRTMVDFIRSRLLLHMSTKINVSILSDFWIKMMRLPLSFFDIKHTGDILQRIGDQARIQNFLTSSTLNMFFSLFNLIIFSFILLTYNSQIFFIFSGASILYFVWIKLFLKHRRKLDYRRFQISSNGNMATMQLVYGMQDIKLNGAEYQKRWEWENVQASLFRLNFKGLSLSQIQQTGVFFLNEGKNVMITFLVATLVVEGKLTLGAMLSIQYIIGSLNSPVENLIGFFQQAQDAKLSLERLNEIHGLEDEEPYEKKFIDHLPSNKGIRIKGLSYAYPGAGNEPVLKNINIEIPEGKTTAIVGVSGSGKTTLLKLLLKFYDTYTGEIRIGPNSNPDTAISEGFLLKSISSKFWRSRCGTVLQDGYIFNDTIAGNIALSEEIPDYSKLIKACKTTNILSFIESLPLGFETKIGAAGNGISEGQKQRILLARAIYKDPEYIFLDEATNSLDANNEKLIVGNLQQFFKGRTVVIVAHRLSTVKNADNIIVLNNGEIVEHGDHQYLSTLRGHYYELVRNQLELGN
jgi:ATP-binding cassette subfamily B protein